MRWFLLTYLMCALATPAVAAPLPGDRVDLGEVLRIVGQEFEGRDDITPAMLLDGALQAASQAIVPLLYESAADGAKTARLRIGSHERLLDVNALTDLVQLEAALESALAFLAQHVPPEEAPEHLEAVLADGLLRALDPHSALLSAAAFGQFQSHASGHVGGLGLLLGRQEGQLTVESVLPDSPAEAAGVHGGDRLLQIGERPALHLPADEALGMIRGRVGTRVALLILRPHESLPRQLTLRRGDLHFTSVSSRMLSTRGQDRIGYVRVRSFQESTTAELTEHLQAMSGRPGSLQGIVLDLRDNPGGVLEQAIRVADLFLDRGTLVTLRGPRMQPEAVPARWYRSVVSTPLVVLINGGTASAGEIVAAALKRNHRALLIGAPTFGKHSIQAVFPLSGGGALKLTVARFNQGSSQALQGRGVMPHLWLRPVTLAERPLRVAGLLATATGVMAERLENPSTGLQPVRELPHVLSAPTAAGAAGEAEPPPAGGELEIAKRLLRLNAPQSQKALLGRALDWAQQERRRLDQEVVQRLASAGVDWNAGSGDNGGQVELVQAVAETRRTSSERWSPLPADAAIPSGAALRLVLTVRNAGARPLHRVLGLTESEAPALTGLELPFGALRPGETADAAVVLELPPDGPAGLEPLRLRIYDGLRRLHYRATLLLPLAAAPASQLRVSIAARDDGSAGSQGNGDGRAQPGERLALRVRLHNAGEGATGPGRYWLSADTPSAVELIRPWRAFSSLPAEASSEEVLLLSVGGTPAPILAALRLNLMSDRPAVQELRWPFLLRLTQPLPSQTLQAPVIDLPIPTAPVAQTTAELRGRAEDDTGLRDVTVYRNGRKVIYQAAAPRARSMPLRLSVPLEPGRNLLRVVARDSDGLQTSRTYLIWQGRGQGFPLGNRASGGV